MQRTAFFPLRAGLVLSAFIIGTSSAHALTSSVASNGSPKQCQGLFVAAKPQTIRSRLAEWLKKCTGLCETTVADGTLVFDRQARSLRITGDAEKLFLENSNPEPETRLSVDNTAQQNSPKFEAFGTSAWNRRTIEDDKSSANFMIGGPNSTAQIRKLSHLNGLTVAELEARLRPYQLSVAGFIGRSESLIKVLADDNDYVTGRGLTHELLAKPLMALMNAEKSARRAYDGAGKKHWVEALSDKVERKAGIKEFVVAKNHTVRVSENHGVRVLFRGELYWVYSVTWMGYQESPLTRPGRKPSVTDSDYIVVREKTGEHISFSGILPELINDWGFYEGLETPYRLSPEKIIEFFELSN